MNSVSIGHSDWPNLIFLGSFNCLVENCSMAAKAAKELLKQHMPPIKSQDQGESTPNHDVLRDLFLEHRFPSAWARSLHWDRAGIAKMLQREKRILFNSRISNGLKQDAQGWITLRGFVQPSGQPSVSAFGYKLCRKMTRADMTRLRYQLAIGGKDYASNLPWLLHSNCLVVSQELDCLVCFCGALTACEHYVPLAKDLSDLSEKLDWARANPVSCKAIIAQANARATELADPALETALRRAVLDRYRQTMDAA
ncbi:glycosyl transferase family 90 [Roseinatronobacter sp.]|uniref:glycosyl transferase family 90 n=1 Tax=Roseinatronobacter sp. TaxID=1945755 RepID=UPI0025D75F06|nr:glycosyl transferase family 90 [Roseibaca sp.]